MALTVVNLLISFYIIKLEKSFFEQWFWSARYFPISERFLQTSYFQCYFFPLQRLPSQASKLPIPSAKDRIVVNLFLIWKEMEEQNFEII